MNIIKKYKTLTPIKAIPRKLSKDFNFTYLDDGSVDMGSSFDLFDVASHYKNELIYGEFAENREYLKNVMESCEFNNYEYEWWHFTLKNEPYPDTYFNFTVEN